MRTRTALMTALVAATAAGSVIPAAAAAPKPKNFENNYAFTDSTPDPSGNANTAEADHCSGKLPQEKPISIKIPGPGVVVASLTATGDWSMQMKDAKGGLLTGDDVNPPENEVLTWRFKKATTLLLLPCNMTGLPSAKVKVTYTYKK